MEYIAQNKLGQLNRQGLAGEANLMLLESNGISIGVRNSGTQAKTNVSLRVAHGIDYSQALEAMQLICKTLSEELID